MHPELSMEATLEPCEGSHAIPIMGLPLSLSNISFTFPVRVLKKNTFPLVFPIAIILPPGETANYVFYAVIDKSSCSIVMMVLYVRMSIILIVSSFELVARLTPSGKNLQQIILSSCTLDNVW
jgi:hypothetical protein